jgi:periplasmic copper chaperone A
MKLTSIPHSIAALMLFAKCCLAGEILVTNATVAMPIVPTAKTAAASFVIINHSSAADSLTAISTPAADYAELHQSLDENGVMHMNPVTNFQIPANTEINLAAQHMHVMLSGLHVLMRKGETIELTLQFEHSGILKVDATVVP